MDDQSNNNVAEILTTNVVEITIPLVVRYLATDFSVREGWNN